MAYASAEAYGLLDEARELLFTFKQVTEPTQIVQTNVPAWLFTFGAQLMIDKSNVLLNNGVEVELTEAHETLTKLISDLRDMNNQLSAAA